MPWGSLSIACPVGLHAQHGQPVALCSAQPHIAGLQLNAPPEPAMASSKCPGLASRPRATPDGRGRQNIRPLDATVSGAQPTVNTAAARSGKSRRNFEMVRVIEKGHTNSPSIIPRHADPSVEGICHAATSPVKLVSHPFPAPRYQTLLYALPMGKLTESLHEEILITVAIC